MLHGNALRSRATVVDARHLHVECPEHKGVLLPVVTVKLSLSNRGDAATQRLYLEALCRHCEQYHYVEVEQGSVAGLPPLEWNT